MLQNASSCGVHLTNLFLASVLGGNTDGLFRRTTPPGSRFVPISPRLLRSHRSTDRPEDGEVPKPSEKVLVELDEAKSSGARVYGVVVGRSVQKNGSSRSVGSGAIGLLYRKVPKLTHSGSTWFEGTEGTTWLRF